MRRIKSELKKLPYVDRSAWRVGEFIHRDLLEYVGRNGRSPPGVRDEGRPDRVEGDPEELFSLASRGGGTNPVLTGEDVTDYGRADFVADPFLFVEDGEYHLFFEIFTDSKDPDAVIGHATSPDSGRSWEYDQVVLKTENHLSFPYVFEWQGERYMIPEMECDVDDQRVTLFKADPFPTDWTPVTDLLRPSHATDDTVAFRWEDRWWLLVGDAHDGDDLYAYYAESDDIETTDWVSHPQNPVVEGRPSAFRPGGRPLVGDDEILLFLQDCAEWYGKRLRAYRITTLTTDEYADREHPSSPILGPSDDALGWNSGCMHHIDPWFVDGEWRCAVDGNVGFGRSFLTARHWTIGMYMS